MTEETKILLSAIQRDAKYDAQNKAIWRFKELLAPILQMSVEEFADLSIKDIILCIDDANITTKKAVDDVSVQLEDSERSSITDKLIRFDVHLKTKNPKLSKGFLVMLHIDLEIQNEYNPSNPAYPITKRAIYYAARELCGQLGILTEQTNYNYLEKVYSIWICNEGIPEELQNSITKFSVCKEDVKGTDNESRDYHDLIDVVIVRRGKEAEKDTIFEYINAVYSNDISTIEKYTDISGNMEIRKELGDIMTASQSLVAKGILLGKEQGIDEGQNILAKAIQSLHAGKTIQDLRKEGFDEKTIDLALACR